MCEEYEEIDLDEVDTNGVPVGEGIVRLDPPIWYSGFEFIDAQIDLKHINYKENGQGVRNVKRSDYNKNDVVQFLRVLDGLAKDQPDDEGVDENGKFYRYRERINSPVKRTIDIEHLLVFDVYADVVDLLISITLFAED